MITPEELARIRSAAIGDMLGDSKVLDEMGPAATVFRLCRELERLNWEADLLSTWVANSCICSGVIAPPTPEDVRKSARKAVGEGR